MPSWKKPTHIIFDKIMRAKFCSFIKFRIEVNELSFQLFIFDGAENKATSTIYIYTQEVRIVVYV